MNEPKKDAPLVFTITDNKGVTYVVHNAEYCGPGYAEGKAEGIVLGELRLARALRRWMNKKLREEDGSYQSPSARLLDYWLTARLRKGKK